MKNLKRIGLFLAALFSAAILLLVFYEPPVNMENEVILLICNTLFIGIIPFIVSVIAAATYIKQRKTGALLMSAGMLVFGLGSIIAGILRTYSANMTVTIHNICAFLSAILILFSVVHESGTEKQLTRRKEETKILFGALIVLCLAVALLTFATIKNFLPPFVDVIGYTPTRHGVLFSAIALFFSAFLFYNKQYHQLKHRYFYWYALSLYMISLGLFGVSLQNSIGGLMSWTGRSAQYLGAVFSLAAIINMYAESAARKAALTDILADFFTDPITIYYDLANTSPSAIISINQDCRIFAANKSALDLFKTGMAQIIDSSMMNLLEQPYGDKFLSDIKAYLSTGSSSLVGHTTELAARDTAGRVFPVDVSISGRRLKEKYAFTLVITDITERKRTEEALQNARFQQSILELAQKFINTPFDLMEQSIGEALGIIGENCLADRVTIFKYDWDNKTARHIYEWDKEPHYYAGNTVKEVPFASMTDIIECHNNGCVYQYVREHDKKIPFDSVTEKTGCETGVVYPLYLKGRLYGTLGVASLGDLFHHELSQNIIRIFCEMLSSVLLRVSIEKELRETNEQMTLILDALEEGVGLYKRDTTAIQVNKHLAERHGKMPQQVIGTNWSDYLPEDKYRDLLQVRTTVLQGAYDTGTPKKIIDERDGRWYHNRFYPVFRDGHVAAVSMISTDITDRMQMEEEARKNAVLENEALMLREKEQEYLEILDSSTAASWIFDFKTKILRYSSQWKARIRAEQVADEDMNLYAMDLVHPEDLPLIAVERANTYSHKLQRYLSQYRIMTVDGYIWVLDQGKVIYDEDNKPVKIFGTSIDITERKKTEEALHKALKLNSEILESINDGFFSLDSEWRFTYVNQRAAEHVGFKPQELIGRNIWNTFPSLCGTKTAEYYRKAMNEKDTIRFEHLWANSKQCYNFSVYPTLNGISIYWQDMTERKLAEEKLRESEERFRIAQEISPDGFTIFHPLRDDSGAVVDFIWVYENDAIAHLNGTSPEQVIGKRLLEWMPGHQGTQLFEAYKHVATTGEAKVIEEVSYVGDTMPILTWFRLVIVSMGEDIAILAQDITARKQTEEALQSSNSRISMILKSIQDDFLVLSRDWTIVYSNQNFASKYGKEPEDFVGSNFWEVFPKYAGTVLEENYRAVMELREGREFELLGPYTNEWYRLKLYPSEEGITILGTMITAYKLAGQVLRESEQKAHALVEELRIADQNKNEFLNALSHELRNPLATIVSGTSFMGMLETNPQTRHVLDIVKRQTNQLCRLIDDLLEVTRITNNKIQLKKESIDLNKLAQTIYHDHKILFSDKGVTLFLHLDAQPIYVSADAARLTQIIGNLLYNALKFTDMGGQAVLSVYGQEGAAYICVEDNGTGIEADFLPELFEPFKQANSTLARSSGGLGLGLAIVKSITELHGGTVCAYSEGLGMGSCFTIKLPLCPQEENKQDIEGSIRYGNN